MASIGLLGGRGYVGETLLRLLHKHPELEPAWIISRSLAGKAVNSVYPDLPFDLQFESLEEKPIAARRADVIVLALPNGAAAKFVAALQPNQRLLDLSADYRFDESWCYGLPEHNREHIQLARRVSNPGCYATAGQLALAPLRDQLASPPVLFGVSGYSGAGRTPSARNDPDRLDQNLLPYSLCDHIHEREIGYQLGQMVRFMPHVAAFQHGISMTVAATLKAPMEPLGLQRLYDQFYSREPLVEVSAEIPEVKQLVSTPRAQIGGFAVDERDKRQVNLVASLDNLLKGAASQALQNINLMLGFDELAGLK